MTAAAKQRAVDILRPIRLRMALRRRPVDTTHLTPGTFMNNGFNHSEALKMGERFRRRPGEDVYPYDCDPSYGE